jgi:hypothetical protein
MGKKVSKVFIKKAINTWEEFFSHKIGFLKTYLDVQNELAKYCGFKYYEDLPSSYKVVASLIMKRIAYNYSLAWRMSSSFDKNDLNYDEVDNYYKGYV